MKGRTFLISLILLLNINDIYSKNNINNEPTVVPVDIFIKMGYPIENKELTLSEYSIRDSSICGILDDVIVKLKNCDFINDPIVIRVEIQSINEDINNVYLSLEYFDVSCHFADILGDIGYFTYNGTLFFLNKDAYSTMSNLRFFDRTNFKRKFAYRIVDEKKIKPDEWMTTFISFFREITTTSYFLIAGHPVLTFALTFCESPIDWCE